MQEPYHWSSVAAISRKYLSIRYSILPYYYTLFFRAHADPRNYTFYPSSGMVLKPLFFAFPSDKECLFIDSQFMVGEALLVSPQLKLGQFMHGGPQLRLGQFMVGEACTASQSSVETRSVHGGGGTASA